MPVTPKLPVVYFVGLCPANSSLVPVPRHPAGLAVFLQSILSMYNSSKHNRSHANMQEYSSVTQLVFACSPKAIPATFRQEILQMGKKHSIRQRFLLERSVIWFDVLCGILWGTPHIPTRNRRMIGIHFKRHESLNLPEKHLISSQWPQPNCSKQSRRLCVTEWIA